MKQTHTHKKQKEREEERERFNTNREQRTEKRKRFYAKFHISPFPTKKFEKYFEHHQILSFEASKSSINYRVNFNQNRAIKNNRFLW